jgi:hypothetical protein
MRLRPYTYAGHSLNDGVNFKTSMPLDNPEQGASRAIMAERAERRPIFATKTFSSSEITLEIGLIGASTPNALMDTLKAWFDVDDLIERKFICQDIENANKEWYVMCTTNSMMDFRFGLVTVILDVPDLVWYENTESHTDWTITASHDKENITPAGNKYALPRLSFTPTGAGGNRYANRMFMPWRNPLTVSQPNYGLNIVDTVWNTAALVSSATNHVHCDGGVNATDTTIPYNAETGTIPDAGLLYCDTEQIYYSAHTALNLTGCTRGVNGTTNASHIAGAQMNQSLLQANGDDINVTLNGKQANFWLYDVNTANTKVWTTLDFKAGVALELYAALDDTTTTIEIKHTVAMKKLMMTLPAKGMLILTDEVITWGVCSPKTWEFTGCTRGAKDTDAVAHLISVIPYWIEHEIWIYYGNEDINRTGSSNIRYSPVISDSRKPVFDLSSTNTSWVYTSFMSSASETNLKRPGSWTPAIAQNGNTKDGSHPTYIYTGNRGAKANPATEMGMWIAAWLSGTVWKMNHAHLEWELYNPAKFTHITCTGEKYRAISSFPLAQFQTSLSGRESSFDVVWTDATPGSAATWTALAAHAAVALTDAAFVRFVFTGNIAAGVDNYAAYEIEAVTMTLTSANVPQGSLNPAHSCYAFNAKVTNNLTGEWLKFETSCPLNKEVIIDCENYEAYVHDGQQVKEISFSHKGNKEWLTLSPGVANELEWDDSGTGTVTGIVYWRDRNS